MVFFKHVYFPKPPLLKERKVNGKRHYVSPSGKLLPSVTTVTGLLSEAGIQAWKNRIGSEEANKVGERAMSNGTFLHKMFEEFLDNKQPKPSNETVTKLFEQAKETVTQNINNIRAQEVQLYSDKIGIAGRVDCIADYDGVLSVIDFKSAKQKKRKSYLKGYFAQATAYAEMYKELTNQKIEQIVILISAEDGTVEAFKENPDNYIDLLMDVIADYKNRNNLDEVIL